MLAYRAEQGICEGPVAAMADHEQIGAFRGVQQHLRRMTLDDPGRDPLAARRSDFIADHRFKGLLRVFGQALLVIERACPAVALEGCRELPAVTASMILPVNMACLTAQRRAARDPAEPSTPTTILGASLVKLADISLRSFRATHLLNPWRETAPGSLAYIGPSSSCGADQGPRDK